MVTQANSINEAGASGLVNFNGTATFGTTACTQYNVLTGASANTVNNVAPSATSGVPFISQGSSAQPVFGTAVVAGGGTGNTTFTAYSVICAGTTATGAFQNVSGLGSSGNVLVSNGAAALPTWQVNSGVGNLVLIQSQAASSSASLVFTSGITSTYNTYLLVWSNYTPQTTTTLLELQVSTNGGSSYIATNYQSDMWVISHNMTGVGNVNSTTFMYLNQNISTGAFTSGQYWLTNVTNGNAIQGYGIGNNSSDASIEFVAGTNTANTINALKILSSSGNLANGTFTLYGLLE